MRIERKKIVVFTYFRKLEPTKPPNFTALVCIAVAVVCILHKLRQKSYLLPKNRDRAAHFLELATE